MQKDENVIVMKALKFEVRVDRRRGRLQKA